MHPWKTLDTARTPDGELKLLCRAQHDYMITIAGRVLMVSQAHCSEVELSRNACQAMPDKRDPKMLIGGLGLGYTLRAALDKLPDGAQVTVAEITEQVVDWCRGPIAHLSDDALSDPRVRVEVADVAEVIRKAAKAGPAGFFDAIVLDLYEGPNEANRELNHSFYGDTALHTTHQALKKGGILAVWSEDPDAHFEKRLVSAGFNPTRRRPDGGARRHTVYLAKKR